MILLQYSSLIYLVIGVVIVFKSTWMAFSIETETSLRLRDMYKNHPIIGILTILVSIFVWPFLLKKR